MGHYLSLIQEPAKTVIGIVVVFLMLIGGLWGDHLVALIRQRSRKP